jgi:hypothetical protein
VGERAGAAQVMSTRSMADGGGHGGAGWMAVYVDLVLPASGVTSMSGLTSGWPGIPACSRESGGP